SVGRTSGLFSSTVKVVRLISRLTLSAISTTSDASLSRLNVPVSNPTPHRQRKSEWGRPPRRLHVERWYRLGNEKMTVGCVLLLLLLLLFHFFRRQNKWSIFEY
ncbi:unnamed protein product, partial [Pylaiella littoralis]